MADTNSDDGLLLLELGIEPDEDEFRKATLLLEDLRKHLDDFSLNLDLGSLLSGLRTAGSILKGIVDMWNSLENKALDVSFSTNDYLPYNITPGQRQNIENRLSESKVAAHFGVTSENVLSTLSNIISTQGNPNVLGDLNNKDVIALGSLGHLLNNPQLQGSNLSKFFTDNSTSYVYETLTSALADAYRLAYSKPEGSEERERILQYIKKVEETPYISPEVSHYISFMTEPNSPDYAHSGNPIYRFFNSGVEDEGPYMDRLQKSSVRTAANSEDIATTWSEAKEAVNQTVVSLVNALQEDVVLPFSTAVQTVTDAISGKKMRPGVFGSPSMELFGGFNNKFNRALLRTTETTINSMDKSLVGSLASHFGLSSNWVENTDMGARAKSIFSGIDLNDPLSTELGFYELMRLSTSDYEKTAKDATAFAIEQIGAKYGKTTFKDYKSTTSLNSAIAKSMLDSNSSFYVGNGGFLDIYNMLYRNDVINEKQFLDVMADVFKNTKMNEIGAFLGYSGTTDITKAEVVKDKATGLFKLEVTIKDAKTGELSKGTYTSEELANGIKASY